MSPLAHLSPFQTWSSRQMVVAYASLAFSPWGAGSEKLVALRHRSASCFTLLLSNLECCALGLQLCPGISVWKETQCATLALSPGSSVWKACVAGHGNPLRWGKGREMRTCCQPPQRCVLVNGRHKAQISSLNANFCYIKHKSRWWLKYKFKSVFCSRTDNCCSKHKQLWQMNAFWCVCKTNVNPSHKVSAISASISDVCLFIWLNVWP